MELRFTKKTCQFLRCAFREAAVRELTQEIRLPQGMADVGRVLSSWGQVILRGKEWQGDRATLNGGLMLWVLYEPEDGTAPACVDSWVPFQLRWEYPDDAPDGTLRVSPLLRFLDTRVLSARKLMVRAGVGALAEGLCRGETELYTPEEIPEDVQLLRRVYPVRLPRETGEKTFELDQQIPVHGAPVGKLISFTLDPAITESRMLGSRLLFRGTGHLHTVYESGEGRLCVGDYEIPFSQFDQLSGTYGQDARAEIWMGLTGLELEATEDGQLRLKCGLTAQYVLNDCEMIEVIEDGYSPLRKTVVHTQLLTLPAILEQKQERLTPEKQFPDCGQGLCAGCLPDFPQVRQTEQGVSLTVPADLQLLYQDAEGKLRSVHSRQETELTVNADPETKMEAMITRIGPALLGGNSTVTGQLQITMTASGGCGIPMVTGMEIGEPEPADDQRPSLVLCRPGKEDIWELAKRYGSTVDRIRQANGEDADPDILLIPLS